MAVKIICMHLMASVTGIVFTLAITWFYILLALAIKWTF
jgi:hypothetical protein